jgi:hypothetical protein
VFYRTDKTSGYNFFSKEKGYAEKALVPSITVTALVIRVSLAILTPSAQQLSVGHAKELMLLTRTT